MNTRSSLSAAFLLVLAALFLGQPARAQDARAVLQRVQQTHAEGGTLRADVTQTTTSPFSGSASSFSGTLTAQGDRYRVETEQQTFVTDGQTVWIYNRPRHQVVINNYIENETVFTPSDFFSNFGERFTVKAMRTEQQDGAAYDVLTLEPKEERAPVREVTLWVRSSDAVVARAEVLDVNDAQITFDLKNVRFDPSVDASTFRFEPPQGAEVVDLRPE